MVREEAIQILADLIDSPFLHTWEKQCKALHMAIEALQTDLVRCKGCRHRYEEGDCTHYYWCRLHDRPVDDTDYCAWGESEVEE